MIYKKTAICLVIALLVCSTGCQSNNQQAAVSAEPTGQFTQESQTIIESTTAKQEESSSVEIDYEALSIEELQELSNKGDDEAQFQLGFFYNLGQKVEKDKQKAFEWYTKAAEQGNAYAQYNLGSMYYNGNGIQQDYQKAFEWYSKAAKQGDDYAQYALGSMYYDGDGTEQNTEEAIKWLTKSAEQGNKEAQASLGRIYQDDKSGVQDYQKAIEWYTKAAEQGYIYAQFQLGHIYFNGKGVQQDYQKAFEWYSKVAEQGDVDAQFQLGVMYLNGQGVQQDYQKAFEWFAKAAEQGDAYAQYNLGLMYYNGYGVQQDYQKAFEWATKSAKQGNEEAKKLMAKIDSEVGTDFESEPTTKAKLIGTREEVKEDMKNRLPKEYQSDKNFLCEAYMANEEKNLFDIDIQLEIGTDSIDEAKKIFYELLDSVSETEYNIEMYSFTFLNNGKSIGIIMAEVGSDTYTLLKNGKLTDFTR